MYRTVVLQSVCARYPPDTQDIKLIFEPKLQQWLVFEVRFGMPLFDPLLNKAVCARIESCRLFDPASVSQHAENNRALCAALDAFIEQSVVPELQDVSHGNGNGLALPDRVLKFRGSPPSSE